MTETNELIYCERGSYWQLHKRKLRRTGIHRTFGGWGCVALNRGSLENRFNLVRGGSDGATCMKKQSI